MNLYNFTMFNLIYEFNIENDEIVFISSAKLDINIFFFKFKTFYISFTYLSKIEFLTNKKMIILLS